MARVSALFVPTFVNPLSALLHRLQRHHRARRDARILDALPRERLEDIGIAPRSEANRRHSGESAPVPRAQRW